MANCYSRRSFLLAVICAVQLCFIGSLAHTADFGDVIEMLQKHIGTLVAAKNDGQPTASNGGVSLDELKNVENLSSILGNFNFKGMLESLGPQGGMPNFSLPGLGAHDLNLGKMMLDMMQAVNTGGENDFSRTLMNFLHGKYPNANVGELNDVIKKHGGQLRDLLSRYKPSSVQQQREPTESGGVPDFMKMMGDLIASMTQNNKGHTEL